MSTSVSSKLRRVMRDGRLIRFTTRFEKPKVKGYVVAVATRWVLVQVVSDRMWLDGFECFRIGDVRNLQYDPNATFVEAALKKRGEKRGRKPRIDLSDTAALLRSAAKASPLVSLHLETTWPGTCYIGRLGGIDGKTIAMQHISPSASWDEHFEPYPLKGITRVGFDADYENALYLVGGEPPTPNRK